jgi:hypothetical protein
MAVRLICPLLIASFFFSVSSAYSALKETLSYRRAVSPSNSVLYAPPGKFGQLHQIRLSAQLFRILFRSTVAHELLDNSQLCAATRLASGLWLFLFNLHARVSNLSVFMLIQIPSPASPFF